MKLQIQQAVHLKKHTHTQVESGVFVRETRCEKEEQGIEKDKKKRERYVAFKNIF